MNNIGSFFDKFKSFALVELRKREVVSKVIENLTKHKLNLKDISIKEGIINIKSNSVLKNEIFIKKTKIIEEIKKASPELKVKDIK
jgi:hypothetical protein